MKDKRYEDWLRNAYEYYHGEGFVTLNDHQWDAMAREFATRREEFDELRGTEYEGGSLFWLKRSDYPDWARVAP